MVCGSEIGHNSVVRRLDMTCVMFIVVFIFVSVVTVSGNEADLRKIDAIQPEADCLRMGGICTIASDCPDGHLSEQRGLCPKQRSQGIECCHGISMKETRCEKHGGVCMSSEKFCNPRLVYDGANDCEGNTRCCIMTL